MSREKIDKISNKTNLSKIARIMEYYCNKLYKNIKNKETIETRKVYIDLIIKYITHHNKRPEYKIFIKTKRGLPEIQINNQGVFFLFCIIHGFVPILDKIIISNYGKEIDITQYKNFILLNRLFHIFFSTGFNFVTYDTIYQLIKNESFIEIFEKNDLQLLSSSELLSVISTLEDIKKTTFDAHKHHFNKNLGKLNNIGLVSEYIFLEIAMKYENKIREILGFEQTYIKPASFEEDTKYKTDFIWIYSHNKRLNQFKNIPIQLTLVKGGEKFEIFKEFFKKSEYEEILYVSITGKINKKLKKIEKIYSNWIQNPLFREEKESHKFPFFINEISEYIDEFLITYFYLHQIIKQKNKPEIEKISYHIKGIDFSKVKITKKNQTEKNIQIINYNLYYDGKNIGSIKYLKNIGKSKFKAKKKQFGQDF